MNMASVLRSNVAERIDHRQARPPVGGDQRRQGGGQHQPHPDALHKTILSKPITISETRPSVLAEKDLITGPPSGFPMAVSGF